MFAVVSASSAAEGHRGDRVRGRDDRVAAALGPQPGVRRDTVELGDRGGNRWARRRRSRRAALRCRRSQPSVLRSRPASNSFAPAQRDLLADGEEQLHAGSGRVREASRSASDQHRGHRDFVVGTEDRLPRALPRTLAHDRLDRTGERERCRGARSSSSAVPRRSPGMRASRLPVSPPSAAPAPSSSTSRPQRVQCARSRRPRTARSRREGLAIAAELREGVVEASALGLAGARHGRSAARARLTSAASRRRRRRRRALRRQTRGRAGPAARGGT